MYDPIPSKVIRRGLIRGFACPISDFEFVDGADDADMDALAKEQREHTRDIMYGQDSVDGVHTPRDLSIVDRRALYASEQV